MTKAKFLEKCRNIHGYKYNYPNLSTNISSLDYIEIEFNGEIFTQRVIKHLQGKSPEKNTNMRNIEDFIIQSQKIWGERFNYSQAIYKGALKKIKLYDNFNDVFIEVTPSSHLRGIDNKNMNNDQFIKQSEVVSDFSYSYEKCFYKNKTTKVILSCPLHGEFLIHPFNHLNYGSVCKLCDFSKFEKQILKYLNKHEISYYRQHKFENCKNTFLLPFDFYLPFYNLLIEFDGIQHFQPIEHFGGLDAYEKLKINYNIKNNYCEENFINLIRIRYDEIEQIGKILDSHLKFFL